jgi:glycosyltransferase involved in cell wall biosynthesis
MYVRILAKHLAELGHQPLVACPKDSFLARDCRQDGIEVLNGFRFDKGFTPISFCRDIRAAGEVRGRNQVDLVHTNGSRDHWVMAAANLASGERLPLVRTYHNTRPVRQSPWNRWLYRNTDRVISVCHYVKDMLSEASIFEGQEMAVIHNGIELERFSPMPPDPNVSGELGLSPDDIVVGIIGRLDWDKGHRYLFEAAAPMIQGEYPRLKILVVGFGKKQPELVRLCQRLGVSANVKFLGARNDIRELISVFDIGAHPSIGVDTSSYAVKEMMAMEKPVVLSTYGGLSEIAEDGVSGFYVPPRDSHALQKRLTDLCRSRGLRRTMGKAARQRVEREFTSIGSVRKTLEVYEETIERFGKRAQ